MVSPLSSPTPDNNQGSRFPMDDATWQAIICELGLPPQEACVVELILVGRQDAEIAADMNLAVPTIRMYLRRTFDRTATNNRLQLVLRIFGMAQQVVAANPNTA